MEWLDGKKSYITGIGGLLLAIGGYMSGTLDLGAAVAAAWLAIQSMNLRHGIGKK